MNVIVPRFLKTAYRKEPISSFILIVGAADALIGGMNERWTLLSFGILMGLTAVLVRWWQTQPTKPPMREESPRQYLPPSSSRPPLPLLTHEKHRR